MCRLSESGYKWNEWKKRWMDNTWKDVDRYILGGHLQTQRNVLILTIPIPPRVLVIAVMAGFRFIHIPQQKLQIAYVKSLVQVRCA